MTLNTISLVVLNQLQISLFPLGGFLIVAKDFDGPDVESEEVRERIRLRRRKLVTAMVLSFRRLLSLRPNSDKIDTSGDFETRCICLETHTISFQDEGVRTIAPSLDRHTTHTIQVETSDSRECTERKTSTTKSSTPTVDPDVNTHSRHLDLPQITPGSSQLCQSQSHWKRFLAELLKPIPIVIVIAVVIALVNPLKALFLPPSASFQPRFRPVAPDGQPPLAFLLDTATFIGAASVPLGLVCVGSALARLRLDTFPRGAIVSMTLVRLVITPIFGIAVTRLFTHIGFVDREDKVLQFICM